MHVNAGDLLSKRAELTPDRVALVELATGRRYSYAELNARANRLANWLRRLGVEQGDRVSILAHNSVVYIDLFFGLAKLGAIFAPLNWRLTARELAYIVNDCEPKVLLFGPEFVGLIEELRPLVRVPHYVALEGATIPGALSYDYERETARASAAEPVRPQLDEEATCCILYTSGTTGRPKGAMIPHRQVLWNCINTAVSWGLTEQDVSPVFTPLFHAGGLFAFLTPLFYLGGRLVLARTFDPEASLRTIAEERCTVILGVPTLFKLWMEAAYFPEADFSSVRFFISGGAPCPISLIEAWRKAKGVNFRQGYGLTEAGVNCFTMTDEEAVRKAGSVGKPIFHSRARVVDPETGRDVPPGEEGELWLAGPHVCSGYWRDPQATAEAFSDEPGGPWFRTGDIARRDEEGFYYIVGRYKDMIKSGGENIYAAEVEAVFREHPAVAEAALIGVPDEKWGEVGLMVVVLKEGRKATEEELRAFCEGKLARYKIPKRVVFTDSLPYSPYGKVIKAELRKRFVG
ncbi:MAG: long-chain fatty acid--CoA ligase [Candidatus Acetothermia bacterium]|jgi:fatty-acyl-CoA synthase|nr:long-chain fatty acid--CoA ligase [Candidatus Acetothermia bacterium]MDH7504787.1 long-chain fatty acid--CoA ligase [Candidatus Acetothermia bacterium]